MATGSSGGKTNGNSTSGATSLRAALLVLGVLVPIAAIVTVGFILFYNWRWNSIASRRYRALANVGTQLTETLASIELAFRSAASSCAGKTDEKGRASRSEDESCKPPAHLKDVRRLILTDRTPRYPSDPLVWESVAPSTYTALVPGRRGSLTYYLSYGSKPGDDQEDLCKTNLCAQLDVGELIEQLLVAEGIDDEVLVASQEGRVVLQRYGTRNLIQDLSKLDRACGNSLYEVFGAKEEKKEPGGERDKLIPGRVEQVCYRNLTHDLVVTPTRLALAAAKKADAKSDPSAPGSAEPAKSKSLVLASLTPDSAWTQAASTVPPLWPAVAALLVMLVALSWPAVKIWTMGPRERLSNVEIRILVLSALLFSGLATLLVRDFAMHYALATSFDEQMRVLANQVRNQLFAELAYGRDVLADLTQGRIPPPESSPRAFDALILAPDGTPSARFFSEIDEATGKRQVTSLPPPDRGFADRQYFKDAMAGRWWGLGLTDGSSLDTPVAVESVRSRTTSEFSVAVAIRIDATTPWTQQKPGVAVVALPMTSLENPILPAGLAFAIVDQAGKVQLHSNSAKNLGENIIEECDDNSQLSSLLETRRAGSLSGSCYRLQQRIFVEPIKDTPWSIVVLREKGLLQTVYVEVAMIWLALFGAYLICFLILMLLIQVFVDGYRAPWLWPQRSHTARYLSASGCLAATAVFGEWATGQSSVTGTVVLVAALSALSTAFLCLALGDENAAWENWLAACVAFLSSMAVFAVTVRFGDPNGATIWVLVLAAWLAPFTFAAHAREQRAAGSPSTRQQDGVPATDFGPDEHSRLKSREARFRFSYSLMLLTYLGVLAIAPSLVFFRDARDRTVTGFIKFGQLAFQQARLERAQKLRARLFAERRSPVVTDRLIDERLPPDARVSETGLFPTSWLYWSPDVWHASRERSSAHCCAARDSDRMCLGCDPSVAGENPTFVSDLVLPGLPAYQYAAAEIRLAVCDGASDAAWCWEEADAERGDRVEIQDRGLIKMLGSSQAARIPEGITEDPLATGAHDRAAAMVGLLALLLGIALLSTITRLIFLLKVDRGGRVGDAGPPSNVPERAPRLFAYLRPSSSPPEEGPPPNASIDVRSIESTDAIQPALDRDEFEKAHFVDIHHLEAGLLSPSRAATTLRLVSKVLAHDKNVTLWSQVDPIYFLTDRIESAAKARRHATPAESAASPEVSDPDILAWSSLLADFRRRMVEVAPEALGYQWMRGRNFDSLGGRNWNLWSYSTETEKLALRHLAEEGFLSPADGEVATSLMRRGLLYRAPAFDLLDKSFRKFALIAVSSETCTQWEEVADKSIWARLRVPLSILVGLAAVLVVVTQRETFYTAIGIASAAAALLPRVISLFGKLGGESSAGS